MKTLRIFGPPGTGKTTTLINLMCEEIHDNGVLPEEIGFFAFNVKAAEEVKSRLSSDSRLAGIDSKRFKNVMNIHRFSKRNSPAAFLPVVDIKEFATDYGLAINVRHDYTKDEEEEDPLEKVDNVYLDLIKKARATRKTLTDVFDELNLDESASISYDELILVRDSYEQYKNSGDELLIDYEDMIDIFLREGTTSGLKVIFIDEAQDLTAQQWEFFQKVSRDAERAYIAGDDDQCIYSFTGANPYQLMNLETPVKTLEQSYRLPRAVHEQAMMVVKRIQDRVPKVYKPRDADGYVSTVGDWSDIDYSEYDGSWLLIAPTTRTVMEARNYLRQQDYYFEYFGHNSVRESYRSAIMSWIKLQKKETLNYSEVLAIYKLLTKKDLIHGAKKKIIDPTQETKLLQFTYELLRDEFGLLVSLELDWFDVLSGMEEEDKRYIKSLMDKEVDLDQEPQIKLLTIHQAKGREADNVALSLQMSALALKKAENSEDHLEWDNIHRQVYVGITRSKNRLFYVQSYQASKEYPI